MDNSINMYFNKMTELVSAKKQLLTEMLKLTNAQTPVIKEGSLDELQKLIEEKQKLIDQIDKLDIGFSNYLEQLKAATGVSKLEEIDVSRYPGAIQLKQATAEVLEIVREISGIEKVNSEKSKELLKQLGSQIQRINQGRKINNAYSKPKPAGTPSFFMDKKG